MPQSFYSYLKLYTKPESIQCKSHIGNGWYMIVILSKIHIYVCMISYYFHPQTLLLPKLMPMQKMYLHIKKSMWLTWDSNNFWITTFFMSVTDEVKTVYTTISKLPTFPCINLKGKNIFKTDQILVLLALILPPDTCSSWETTQFNMGGMAA